VHFSQQDLEFLIDLTDKASAAILEIYESDFSVMEKDDFSPITAADLLANEIYIEALQERWPAIPILSEESTNKISAESKTYWALDPLDGTKEFINKNGQFTVNLALIQSGVPIFGIVAAPAIDLLYVGGTQLGVKRRAKGLWLDLFKIPEEPDWFDCFANLRVAASRSHPSDDLVNWLNLYPNHELYELGSSLKLCHLLENKVDCYPRLGVTSIWDIAAGHALLKALGGEIWVWPIEHRIALRYSEPSEVLNPSFIAVGASKTP
jgi:3'(2'), 5'-bisphosphate nucleotidase